MYSEIKNDVAHLCGSASQLADRKQLRTNNKSRHNLCSVCTQNQLLKVKQLANFVPQNEVK